MLKKLIVNIGLSILSLSVGLVGSECLVRRLLPQYNPAAMVKFYFNPEGVLLGMPNTIAHHRMKAGDFSVQVHFNQYGLRDTKDLKDSTSQDWFVVGDSFSFGHGVEEDQRYSNLVETMLGTPVYNISIPTDFDGYEKLIAYAQQHGAAIDHVLLGICMENDLQSYSFHAASSGSAPLPETTQTDSSSPYYTRIKQATFFRLKIFLANKLAVYNLLISAFHQNQFLKNITERLGIMDKYVDGINRMRYSEAILQRACDRLMELQKQRHITELVVLIIPSRALWIGENQTVERRIHQQFVAMLKQRGFAVIDMLPYFEADGNPLHYHFTHDGHWNAQGHRKAAEVIAAYLRVAP